MCSPQNWVWPLRPGGSLVAQGASWVLVTEIYSPPNNISVHCNVSHCLIQWEKPVTRHTLSNREFKYQLDIQRLKNKEHSGNQLIEVSGNWENKYNFPSPEPRAKHTVKIRTSDARIQRWGSWSQPVEFGSDDPEASLVHIYMLVVLGTLVSALIIGCLLKRFLASRRLFPRIPHVKTNGTTTIRLTTRSSGRSSSQTRKKLTTKRS